MSFEDPGSKAPVLRPRFRDPGSETQVQRPAKRRIVISTYQARIAKSWAFGPARCICIPNIHGYCVPLQSWHTEAAHSDVLPCRSGASLLFNIPCNAGPSHVLWHPLQESADMWRVTTASSCGMQVAPSTYAQVAPWRRSRFRGPCACACDVCKKNSVPSRSAVSMRPGSVLCA